MTNLRNSPRAVGGASVGAQTSNLSGSASAIGITASRNPLDQSAGVLSSGAEPIPGLAVYFGASAAGPLDAAAIEALTSVPEGAHLDSFTVAPSNQKVVYAYPTSFGAPTFSVDGLTLTQPGDWLASYTVSISGTTYTVLETTNLLTDPALPFVRVS